MDSLANYGSDDEYEDSPDEQQTDWRKAEYIKKDLQRSTSYPEKQADANYEEVQMDLSEESNDGSRNSKETRDKRDSSSDRRCRDSPNQSRRKNDKHRREDNKSRDRSRSRDRRDSRDDDRFRDRKERDERYGSKADRYSRDDKGYRKDNFRDRKYRRSSSRDRRRSNSQEKRRSGSRERKRSPSRERKYSKSPKRDRSRRSRSRSRSRSRGRYTGGPPRRYGYPKNNLPRNESTETSADNQGGDNKDRFFMPGITGKYREQIEKRKLLWQKKEPPKQGVREAPQAQPPAGTSTSRVTKIWEATTFAQDQDGKVASKFKRLMGIKGQNESAPAGPTDIIKKQEEMFSSMEQQYEVARTATHTMRGVGLGFSSSYPR